MPRIAFRPNSAGESQVDLKWASSVEMLINQIIGNEQFLLNFREEHMWDVGGAPIHALTRLSVLHGVVAM